MKSYRMYAKRNNERNGKGRSQVDEIQRSFHGHFCVLIHQQRKFSFWAQNRFLSTGLDDHSSLSRYIQALTFLKRKLNPSSSFPAETDEFLQDARITLSTYLGDMVSETGAFEAA